MRTTKEERTELRRQIEFEAPKLFGWVLPAPNVLTLLDDITTLEAQLACAVSALKEYESGIWEDEDGTKINIGLDACTALAEIKRIEEVGK